MFATAWQYSRTPQDDPTVNINLGSMPIGRPGISLNDLTLVIQIVIVSYTIAPSFRGHFIALTYTILHASQGLPDRGS